MTLFFDYTSGADHFRQLLDPVMGLCGACFAGSDLNADDV